jgi:SAM-dependent methyltransferase
LTKSSILVIVSKPLLPPPDFYDLIAEDYDHYLSEADRQVREIVKDEFLTKVNGKNVLDFGAGTGLDMLWLSSNYDHLFFLEPAINMREIAKRSTADTRHKIIFVEDHLDYSSWTPSDLPFATKLDGVLANFGVLNCIADISLFFDKIALLCNAGCYFIATVVDSTLKAVIKYYSLKTVIQNLLNDQAVVYSNNRLADHKTYIHTIKHYKAAANNNFEFINYTSLNLSNLALLILRKK